MICCCDLCLIAELIYFSCNISETALRAKLPSEILKSSQKIWRDVFSLIGILISLSPDLKLILSSFPLQFYYYSTRMFIPLFLSSFNCKQRLSLCGFAILPHSKHSISWTEKQNCGWRLYQPRMSFLWSAIIWWSQNLKNKRSKNVHYLVSKFFLKLKE